jgi:hypothetical protein
VKATDMTQVLFFEVQLKVQLVAQQQILSLQERDDGSVAASRLERGACKRWDRQCCSLR